MTLIIRHISWKDNRKRMPGEADSNGLLLEDGAYPKPLIQRALCHCVLPVSSFVISGDYRIIETIRL